MRTPLNAGDRIALATATACGAGLTPKAPGTAGSLVGVGVYVLIVANGWESVYLPLLGGLLIVGVWSAGRVEPLYGHDASRIVIDEVVGQMVTLGWAVHTQTPVVTTSILGFLLFRLFDILKPYPVGRLERLPGGFGVVADDVGAGLYGLLALVLLEFLMASPS